MENNNQTNKKVPGKRIIKRRSLVRQELWNALIEEKENKISNVWKVLKTRYPLRPADGFIILGLLGFYGFWVAVWKNYFWDAMRTTRPYDMYLQYWGLFPWAYNRQPKEPFIYAPQLDKIRDVEMYENYETTKEKILFKKHQQYDVIVRAIRERVTPAQDHREMDTTEFSTLTKMNFDIMSLTILKRNINQELNKFGILKDDKLYIRERLNMDYKSSEYMYKDELYKELNELVDI
jgi:hypothetical protein